MEEQIATVGGTDELGNLVVYKLTAKDIADGRAFRESMKMAPFVNKIIINGMTTEEYNKRIILSEEK